MDWTFQDLGTRPKKSESILPRPLWGPQGVPEHIEGTNMDKKKHAGPIPSTPGCQNTLKTSKYDRF